MTTENHIVKDAASKLEGDLNTITSYPADWAEIAISITARSSAGDVTLTKHTVWVSANGRYWGIRER